MAKNKTAITPTRAENYAEWYQQVVKNSDLAENSPVRGCMVIKPWGFGIWENIKDALDRRFKETGHENAYFPLLVPVSFLEREAEHVDGFAKECAVVTHHRLEKTDSNELRPSGLLEEPFVIRPTSETIIGETYSKWVNSYRDLPILINQWANVMRWEMRTRLFLRTSEFLWQEGHTVHASAEEAREETLMILDIYAEIARNWLAMPVIKGEKTPEERFPGAVETYTIEAMMQDGKALQAGTSHFLGQNFARAFDIKYLSKEGREEYGWTTSWGASTRMIGGLIMTHSDDDGLVLPPAIAPKQVTIIPVGREDEQASARLEYCERLKKQLAEKTGNGYRIESFIDNRDVGGGVKFWESIKKGYPLRIEIGNKELEASTVSINRRCDDRREKSVVGVNEFVSRSESMLADIQDTLYERARKYQEDKTVSVGSLDEFVDYFKKNQDFVECFASCDPDDVDAREAATKPLQVTSRCAPLETFAEEGTCIFTGKKGKKVIFAKAY